jgi:hypothetical protein
MSEQYDQVVERFRQRAHSCAVCGTSDWESSNYAMSPENADGTFSPLSRNYMGFVAFTWRGCQQTLFVRVAPLKYDPEP